jgi:multidrug efflux pump
MKFTDIFIHRPVLASVVSLLILVIGLRAIAALEVRQFPETQNTVVTVTTTYPGASADLVKGFITTPLQQAVAEADGIDFLVSTSTQGRSVIEANMVLNHDANAAVAEIQAKVASQRNVLPAEADDPVIDSVTGDVTALMYLAFYSDTMSPSQITDYLLRVAQPRLQAVPGVAKAGLMVEYRQVQTGVVRDGHIEIETGLQAGERVVSAGQLKLRNGMEVSIDDTVQLDGNAGGS